MVRFFLPIIFLLTIAWLLVGLYNEFNNEFNDVDYLKMQLNLDTTLDINTILEEKLIDKVLFKVPADFSSTTFLTNESDAVLQFFRSNPFIGLIVYSDTLSDDSLAFNYSVKNYVRSEIDRLTLVEMLDSTSIKLNDGSIGIRVKCSYVSKSDTFVTSFLAFENDHKLYMFCVKYYKKDHGNCQLTADSILTSIQL